MNNERSSVAEIDEKHETETLTDTAEDEGPDAGPTMSEAGAMPSGSEMAHWATSQSEPDATRPGTMPRTKSTPLPGEKNHGSKAKV